MYPTDPTVRLHDNKEAKQNRHVFATHSFNLILHCDDGITVIVMRLYATGSRLREIGRFEPPAETYTCIPEYAMFEAAKKVLSHLNNNYTWTNPTMRRVREDAQGFLNFCARLGVDLRHYPNL